MVSMMTHFDVEDVTLIARDAAREHSPSITVAAWCWVQAEATTMNGVIERGRVGRYIPAHEVAMAATGNCAPDCRRRSW